MLMYTRTRLKRASAPIPTMIPVQSAVDRLISKNRIDMIMAYAAQRDRAFSTRS